MGWDLSQLSEAGGDRRTMSGAERGERPSGPITLDQLLALNEEIAALVRAGLPLGRGLLEAGRDVRGRLGRIAGVLGRRMNRGEGLAEALEAERRAIPPLYRAVVEAGARAGPAAGGAGGDGAATSAGSPTPAGRSGWRSGIPGSSLGLAYLLFVGLVFLVVPRFVAAYRIAGPGDAGAAAMAGAGPGRPGPTGGRSARSWSRCCWSSGSDRGRRRGCAAGRGAGCGCSPGWARCWPTSRPPTSPSCWPCCWSTGCRIPRRWCWPPRRPGRPRLIGGRRPGRGGHPERRAGRDGRRGRRARRVPADAALDPGHRPGAGLARLGPAPPGRPLSQARPLPRRADRRVPAHDPHAGRRRRRGGVLRDLRCSCRWSRCSRGLSAG